jgi:transcriptional regulator with XRE-family HTH domain
MLESMQEKEFYKWLGEQYRIEREKRGIKQKDAAKQAKINSGDLSNFENRGKKLSAYRIMLLLKAIEVTMEDLIGDPGKKNSLRLSLMMAPS